MELTFIFAMGILIGIIATINYGKLKKTSGTLHIDTSNPEKDLYQFEIDDLDKLAGKKKIVLKIDNKARLTQE